MSEQVAQQFIDALRVLEDSRDAAPLAALYTNTAEVGNIIAAGRFQGPEGARQFWKEYRETFDQVHSEFRSVIVTASQAALEWTTRGTSLQGAPFSYAGVTILEIADGKVTRSTAYFDPSGLGRQIAEPET